MKEEKSDCASLIDVRSERVHSREARDFALFSPVVVVMLLVRQVVPVVHPCPSVRWWRDPEYIESRIFADFRRASFTHEQAPAGSPGLSAPPLSILRGSLDRGWSTASIDGAWYASTRCLRAFENAHENTLVRSNVHPSACFGTHTQHLHHQRTRHMVPIGIPDHVWGLARGYPISSTSVAQARHATAQLEARRRDHDRLRGLRAPRRH